MANFLEVSTIEPKNFVTATSRYNNSKVLYYTDIKRLTFETYKRSPSKTSQNDKFMVISKGVEYRPDLVSQRVYGFPDWWRKIMEANGMSDILDFKVGTNIRIQNVV